MLGFLKGPVLGVLSALWFITNTLLWAMIFFPVAIVKFIIPLKFWRSIWGKILNFVAKSWIHFNNAGFNITRKIEWDVSGTENLKTRGWYLVISNHQTWIDIPVLQYLLNWKIPFLTFFLKKELIWVPILGMAWYFLDFPFMKRYSPEFIEKNPHLKGKDMEITRKACQKYQNLPVSIMNFAEGTRFTPEKHDIQGAQFNNLLKPKAGGLGFVLSAMGDQLTSILDVTIFYPQGAPTFWSFLCGYVNQVKVHIEEIPVTPELLGNYAEDEKYQEYFKKWMNNLWHKKDERLESFKKEA